MNQLRNFMIAIFLLGTVNLMAQVPQGMNYQAVARNSTGALIANHLVGLRLTILSGSSTGTVVYSEIQSATTNQFGLFTISLGTGIVTTGVFNTINWSTGLYWLKVELDATGGTNYVAMGTSQLLSVPYAFYAASSGTSGMTGTTNYLAKFTGTSLDTSRIFDDGTRIGIGTANPNSMAFVNITGMGTFGSAPYYEATVAVTGAANGASSSGIYAEGGWRGLYGRNPGTAAGVEAIGVYGECVGSNYTGAGYGLKGKATGTGPTNYGVFGDASGATGTNYGVYCSGNGSYTGTWTQVSDKKFKKEVTDLTTDALDDLIKLRPVSYLMNTDEFPEMNFANGKQMGFIAQEMQEVFPSLVEKGVHPGATKEDASIEYLGVNYIGLIPVLVKGMQEQQTIIETQKTELKTQNAKIEDLQKQIDDLKKLIAK